MKQVKIIGLSVNKRLGILEAFDMKFDKNNKLIVIKGEAGAGKTTTLRALQLNTQGSKTLEDKKLYNEIDTEVQLLDGIMPVFVGCKSDKDGKLIYTLYTKDNEGKIVRNPIIDGVKATPSKYLELLQTELTWNFEKLTSENATVQRDILMKLYRYDLIKHGIIFDRKSPEFKNSIIYRIDKAINERNIADFKRKQVGGILEDLIAVGVNPEKPETLPARVKIDTLEEKLFSIKNYLNEFEAEKQKKLSEIKLEAEKVKGKALMYNAKEADKWNEYQDKLRKYKTRMDAIDGSLEILETQIRYLDIPIEKFAECEKLVKYPKEPEKFEKNEIIFVDNTIQFDNFDDLPEEAKDILADMQTLSDVYKNIRDKQPDNLDDRIKMIKTEIEAARENNKLCDAVDAFLEWRDRNNDVRKLKAEYYKQLEKVYTGVPGLKITSDDSNNVFLVYNGEYDPEYFYNEKKEYRKVSAYSGTQKVMVALLVQSHLLNKKSKAMRYLYVDNVPIDTKTKNLLNKMAEKLDVTIFLNITGDFDEKTISDGEILIRNGHIFF